MDGVFCLQDAVSPLAIKVEAGTIIKRLNNKKSSDTDGFFNLFLNMLPDGVD